MIEAAHHLILRDERSLSQSRIAEYGSFTHYENRRGHYPIIKLLASPSALTPQHKQISPLCKIKEVGVAGTQNAPVSSFKEATLLC